MRVPPNFPFRKHTISKEVQKIVSDKEKEREREHLKSIKMADILENPKP